MEPTRRSLILGGTSALGLAALGGLGSADASAATSSGPGLWSALYSLDASMRGGLSVAIRDARTGRRFTYDPPFQNYCASIVKVLILTTVCYHAQQQNRLLTSQEQAIATRMIRNSDNSSATWLWNSVGGHDAVQAMANRLGMTQTSVSPGGTWGLTRTTAVDQVTLIEEIFHNGRFINPSKRAFICSLMGSVEYDQRWGVGRLGGSSIKNGWLQYPSWWVINSIGHVNHGGRDFTVAILQSTPSEGRGMAMATTVAQTIYNHLATPL